MVIVNDNYTMQDKLKWIFYIFKMIYGLNAIAKDIKRSIFGRQL